MILLDDEQIAARWGAHPTTGNVSVYRSIAHAQARAILNELKDIKTQSEENAWSGIQTAEEYESFINRLEFELREGKNEVS